MNDQRKQSVAATGHRRTPWPLAVVAALFVIVPFLTWYGTWFGRTLSDSEIERYLKDDDNPRHEQHALSQVAARMAKHDEGVRRWYPQVVALAGNRYPDVRMTAAWVMGQDARATEFHAALLRLLSDGEPIVRRNAALALVNFNDASSRSELLAMLRPFQFNTPVSGQLVSVLSSGTTVKRGAMLARLKVNNEQIAELRAPLAGQIMQVASAPGAQLNAGQPLLTLAPDADSVLCALVGLRYVGTQEDLTDVSRYAAGVAGLPAEIKNEAAQTSADIMRRQTETGATK
jgi:hypothetical protein